MPHLYDAASGDGLGTAKARLTAFKDAVLSTKTKSSQVTSSPSRIKETEVDWVANIIANLPAQGLRLHAYCRCADMLAATYGTA